MVEVTSCGEWVRRARKSLDLTQAALAQQVGCATVTIRKIERDERRPSRQMAELLAEHLKIPDAKRETFVRLARGKFVPDAAFSPRPIHPREPEAQAPPHNLPPQSSSFVGRALERASVGEQVRSDACWLLTLTGIGGTGKTRLALQVATDLLDDYPSGIFWVELAPLRDAELVAPTLAKVVGMQEIGGADLTERLTEALQAHGPVLVVLDNFEHVLEAAPLLPELRKRAPNVTFLVTSREALHLYGEQEVPVSPLAVPVQAQSSEDLAIEQLADTEAVALFVERARNVRPDFELTSHNAAAVAELCRRLEGLPLAIELAAAHAKIFSPQAMLQRLEHAPMLDWLTSRATDRSMRHQTIRGTIDWSYHLLTPEEKRLFGALGVFTGGFTFHAADALCGNQMDVFQGVAALLDKSLLQNAGEVAGAPRFDMLVPVHEYAAEKLRTSGEMEELAERHLGYYLSLAERAEPALKGAEQQAWLNRLEAERDNLRTALSWALESGGNPEAALRLASALLWFWHARGYSTEAREWLSRALESEENVPASVRAQTLNAAGFLAFEQGNRQQARDLLEESIRLCRRTDDEQARAHALLWLSDVVWDLEQRQALEEESKQLLVDLDDTWSLAHLLARHAKYYLWQGRHLPRGLDQARTRLERSLALYRKADDEWRMYEPLHTQGTLALIEGRFEEAKSKNEEALALCRQVHDLNGIAWSLYHLSEIALHQSNYNEAGEFHRQSMVLFRKQGNRRGMAALTGLEGVTALEKEEYHRAAERLQEACERCRETELWGMYMWVILMRGYALLYAGRHQQALIHFEESNHEAHDAPIIVALAAPGVAASALYANETERGARLLGAAEALHDSVIEVWGTAQDRSRYPRDLARATELLDDAVESQFRAEGRAMSAEEALDYVVQETAQLRQLLDAKEESTPHA